MTAHSHLRNFRASTTLASSRCIITCILLISIRRALRGAYYSHFSHCAAPVGREAGQRIRPREQSSNLIDNFKNIVLGSTHEDRRMTWLPSTAAGLTEFARVFGLRPGLYEDYRAFESVFRSRQPVDP